MKAHLSCLLFTCLISFSNQLGAQPSTFNITYADTTVTQDVRDAFQYAADIWSWKILSGVPIEVRVVFIPIAGGTLGSTIPDGIKDFPNAPMPDVIYVTALANALSGQDLKPNGQDITVIINSNINWYYGTDGNPANNQYDFVSVVLHELGHGLGFVTLFNVNAQNEGTYGTLDGIDFPLINQFITEDPEGSPFVYELFVENGTGEELLDTTLFPNPSTALSQQLRSRSIFFNGPEAVAENGGNRPKLYAPLGFTFGTSILHFDENAFPSGDTNELMTPFIGAGKVNHEPGPLALALLKDLGWTINPYDVGVETGLSSDNSIRLLQNYPNPFSDATSISFQLTNQEPVQLTIFNSLGQEVTQLTNKTLAPGQHTFTWTEAGSYSEGLYIYRLQVGDQVLSKKMYIVH